MPTDVVINVIESDLTIQIIIYWYEQKQTVMVDDINIDINVTHYNPFDKTKIENVTPFNW